MGELWEVLGELWAAFGELWGGLEELWEVLRGLYTETPDQPHGGRYVNMRVWLFC